MDINVEFFKEQMKDFKQRSERCRIMTETVSSEKTGNDKEESFASNKPNKSQLS